MRVLLIFIDGFGIGACDPAINPMVRFPGRFFPALLGVPLSRAAAKLRRDRLYFSAIDAVLGVDGLPQSATGQTSLFTGVNAPQRLGRHIQAFPGPQLKAIIEAEGLMRLLKAEGYDITSANMYTPDYMAPAFSDHAAAAGRWLPLAGFRRPACRQSGLSGYYQS